MSAFSFHQSYLRAHTCYCDRAPLRLSRKGHLTIAQRFSVGLLGAAAQVPKGTAEVCVAKRASLRDATLLRRDPNAKALGYFRVSLRDNDRAFRFATRCDDKPKIHRISNCRARARPVILSTYTRL